MIMGIGIDIVEIERIHKIVGRQENAFLNRVFTEKEREVFPELEGRRMEFIAGRFAAKEAISKALGTGIGKELSFQEMEVIADKTGKPGVLVDPSVMLRVIGTANCNWHLSISHSKQYAVAQAIVEKL
ncbi:holo-ACP synthase [Aneurinibacillus tyrosinisolvens]|uniref:holo-ACP synthase n=1 Tax=Aneurinibacillus tyrosinisolvens TaxID=1443435 RepID=UPI00063F6026|nr:holo-ACP synthase [Aneurinibacillus tyrosinisolvens]